MSEVCGAKAHQTNSSNDDSTVVTSATNSHVNMKCDGFFGCRRWREYLQSSSAAYCELERERLAGWQSKALDFWYKQRQEKQKRDDVNNNNNKSTNVSSSTFVTSFSNSDVEKLCERYCKHAEHIFSRVAPGCFNITPQIWPIANNKSNKKKKFFFLTSTANVTPTFLDLGSAPGGISKYLVTKLHWRGVGVSLPTSRGGIAFDTSWLQSPTTTTTTTGRYEFIEGSITEDDWCAAIDGRKFYFVNGGAVQDHGQRMEEAEEEEKKGENEEGGETLDECGVEKTGHFVLPWFNFFVPQLRLALKYVENGGVIMLVFGVPQCASLFIFLALVKPLIYGTIHILETMHLTKSPVYILLTGVNVSSDEATQLAWANILEMFVKKTREFWLGETDDGLRLATLGFTQYCNDLNVIWEKTTSFLRRRRLQAERTMTESKINQQFLKRPRDW